ncbi:MAG TPA: TetR/AcrR family transcriptional regulator [Iamia sp.]|nr:TetR/AcrR family transcriptional regulator [Iamia sp.]
MAPSGRGRGRPSGHEAVLSTEDLLDAALDAFAERGYDGTSVREVARRLGVSHNLIPQRVGPKEQLWFAAVDHGFEALSADLAATAEAGADLDDVEQLRALVTAFVAANARRPALLRIINQEAVADGPRLDHLFVRYIDPVRQYGADVLARLEAEGRVRSGSVGLVYFLMTHGAGGPVALPGLAARFGEAVDPADEEAVQRHAEAATAAIFDGLLVPGDN